MRREGRPRGLRTSTHQPCVSLTEVLQSYRFGIEDRRALALAGTVVCSLIDEMRLTVPLLLGLTLAACSVVGCAARPASPTRSGGAALDSLILDRGACYGTCDIYQIVVRRDGPTVVRRKDATVGENVAVSDARGVLVSAVDAGVLTLPDRIRSDSTLCPLEASDHSTITLSAFSGPRVHRVEHYTGCYADHELHVTPRLERLVLLERRIDALVTGNGTR